MKNVYMVAGAVIIAAASFVAGMYFDMARGAMNTVEGVIVSRDDSSITVRTADGSARSIPFAQNAFVAAQPEALIAAPDALVVGAEVSVTLSGGEAATVLMRVPAQGPVQ